MGPGFVSPEFGMYLGMASVIDLRFNGAGLRQPGIRFLQNGRLAAAKLQWGRASSARNSPRHDGENPRGL